MELLIEDTQDGKIYKYRAINENSLQNLRESTLYCAMPSQFNDPFDCKIGIDIQSLIDAKYGNPSVYIEKYLNDFINILKDNSNLESFQGNEKVVLQKWLHNETMCLFFKKYINLENSDSWSEDYILDYFEIMESILLPFFKDESFSSDFAMSQVKKRVEILILKIIENDRGSLFDEKVTPQKLAMNLGLYADADEISTTRLLCQELSPDEKEQAIIMDNSFKEAEKEIAKSVDKEFRIGSLATDYKNRLMWSHYANGHTGFCVEYDFSLECKEREDVLILPVVYSKERPKFPWKAALTFEEKNEENMLEAGRKIINSLLVKDDVWEYENEWRIITYNSKKIENIKMPPISCIYIGALCKEEDKTILIEVAKKLKVPIKQMVVDRGEYTLHVEEYG